MSLQIKTMPTDTTDRGLETLIMRHLTGKDGFSAGASGILAEAPPLTDGSDWFADNPAT